MNGKDIRDLRELGEILGKLDERSRNIYHLLEKQERHLSRLNESVSGNTTGIAVNRVRFKYTWWVVGSVVVVLITKLVGLI